MLNNSKGNSNLDMLKFSADIERIFKTRDNTSALNSINNKLSSDAKSVGKAYLLNSYIDDIDKPILKGFAKEVAQLAKQWVSEPIEILCCLVQGLWSIYASTILEKLNKYYDRDDTGFDFNFDGFIKFIDSFIMLIDLIIVLLTDDCKSIALKIPDFIKEITDAVFGAMLLMIQETLNALKDSTIGSIINYINSKLDVTNKLENFWAKCIPFAQLIDILRRYLHDYGLFASIFEKIKGYTHGLAVGWKEFASKIVLQSSQLQFLYFIRDFLYKLKLSVINLDLCVSFSYRMPDNTVIENLTADEVRKYSIDNNNDLTPEQVRQRQKLNRASDGTILVDSSNIIPLLTNSSIRGFLNKYYGYPTEIVDNILTRGSSLDHIQGTLINSNNLSNLNADCPNTPSPLDLMAWTRALTLQGKE